MYAKMYVLSPLCMCMQCVSTKWYRNLCVRALQLYPALSALSEPSTRFWRSPECRPTPDVSGIQTAGLLFYPCPLPDIVTSPVSELHRSLPRINSPSYAASRYPWAFRPCITRMSPNVAHARGSWNKTPTFINTARAAATYPLTRQVQRLADNEGVNSCGVFSQVTFHDPRNTGRSYLCIFNDRYS